MMWNSEIRRFYERGKNFSGAIRREEFLEELSDYQIFQKNSALWS
jgi:hypothetical protein